MIVRGAHDTQCCWGPSRERKEPWRATSSNWCPARASQGRDAVCNQLTTGAMLARPQSLGMLCLWGGIPREA